MATKDIGRNWVTNTLLSIAILLLSLTTGITAKAMAYALEARSKVAEVQLECSRHEAGATEHRKYVTKTLDEIRAKVDRLIYERP